MTAVLPSAAGVIDGERRKRDMQALLAERRAVYVRRGQRALVERLLLRDVATADDVRALVPLPAGIDPRLLGSVPGPLAAAGIIYRSDYVPSCRPERHASIIAVWRLGDRAGALDWLATHSELPDPLPGDGQQLTLWD